MCLTEDSISNREGYPRLLLTIPVDETGELWGGGAGSQLMKFCNLIY